MRHHLHTTATFPVAPVVSTLSHFPMLSRCVCPTRAQREIREGRTMLPVVNSRFLQGMAGNEIIPYDAIEEC